MRVPWSVPAALRDDWVSDFEIQSDYRDEFSLSAEDAYRRMIADLAVDLRDGVLVAGDLVDGFRPWGGGAQEVSDRFVSEAGQRSVVTSPGQLCWFDLGPHAPRDD